MIRTLALALLLLAGSAAAQPVPPGVAPVPAGCSDVPANSSSSCSGRPLDAAGMPPPAPVAPAKVLPRVSLATAKGTIVIALETGKAPVTGANFLRYVDQKRFDGMKFYRAYNVAPDGSAGLVQAGVRGVKALPPIKHEPTSQTGLSHTDGAVSMARLAPGTASGDFFIIIGTLTALDASDKDPGYAVFGHVVEGMDVVKAILAAPVSAGGDGAMKGQMIAVPITVTTARRVK